MIRGGLSPRRDASFAKERSLHKRGTMNLRIVEHSATVENVSLECDRATHACQAMVRCVHRPRTDRTVRSGKMKSHAKSMATLGKIASFLLRDERVIAAMGGAPAG